MGFRGKVVATDHYFHISTIGQISDRELASRVSDALSQLNKTDCFPNVVKVNERTQAFSLLDYPDFDTDPFPALAASWVFSRIDTEVPSLRSYKTSANPPILHRKELLVQKDYPQRQNWVDITNQAELLGLFEDTSTIGFRLNWENLIVSKGYTYDQNGFTPIGNHPHDGKDSSKDLREDLADVLVQRHLTALSRSTLSAPVQLLTKHGLLTKEKTFFDYGCGKGDDIESLIDSGISAQGWDPHFSPETPLIKSNVVNLGFVINVIENPAERVQAITKALSLADQVLSVSVMLYPSLVNGLSYRDGFISSRSTFQKYFTQSEFKDFLEQVTQKTVHMVGPGVAFIFSDIDLEQNFSAEKFRSQSIAKRLIGFDSLRKRAQCFDKSIANGRANPKKAEIKFQESKAYLDQLWKLALQLGRWPSPEEIQVTEFSSTSSLPLRTTFQMIKENYDLGLLKSAARARTDDLAVFFATQQFQSIPSFRSLSPNIQLDIKTFFGDYRSAQLAGIKLLKDTSDVEKIFEACTEAAEQGLGWLYANHSLQLHANLVERLPAVLRLYVACGLLLWDSISEVDMIKIHIHSGKLTLLEFDDFESNPLPLLRRRIKINLRKLDYDVFEYGTAEFPKPYLTFKSRYMHEDLDGFAAQIAFDNALQDCGVISEDGPIPVQNELFHKLELARLKIDGMKLSDSTTIPSLDQQCGSNFTYRSFIECGDTQERLQLANLPGNAQSFNAIHALAVRILDPIIDYFGAIRLTYGFCSHELSKHISLRVAHHLDQHVSFERNSAGKRICSRGGAACDFIIEDENMEEVADWIIEFLQFDRMYFYGSDRPLHISYSDKGQKKAYRMCVSEGGRLMPKPYSSSRLPS
jgi:DNA phosphorothioation-associated putative methyltransferase